MKLRKAVGFWALWFLLLPTTIFAGIPEIKNLMVTDVTTVSFSVIWAASEASTADVQVFEDADGTIPSASAIITSHPVQSGDMAIQVAAEDSGVMKVMVTGLEAGNTYYFNTASTSKSTSETTTYPSDELLTVMTQVQTVRTYQDGSDELPFSNDIIIEPCYLEDGTTPAEGSLLIATVAGGAYPITAFVGDGVELPYALIDLNNMFSRETSENIDLSQGSNLTLLNFRGIFGNSIVTYDNPLDQSLCEVKPADHALKAGWNMLSFQLDPANPDALTVLDPIMDQLDAIWSYDPATDHWYRYDKNNPFPWLNDLATMSSQEGYWIVMNQEASLEVHGAIASNPIQLFSGWNLVGSKSIETVPVLNAVASISDYFIAIWHYDTESDAWLRYDVNNPFPWLNDLQAVEPGKAYWIVVDQDCTW